jgi:hypothetical protein
MNLPTEVSAEEFTSKRMYRRKEAAAYITKRFGLPVASTTLAKLAVLGGGPAFHKAGHYPLYPADCLDDWATAKIGKRVASTAEYPRGTPAQSAA